MEPVAYAPYTPGVLARGGAALLFFASEDPFSAASDAFLRSVYPSSGATIPTYRVAFSTSTGARLTYGVLIPNTFVLIDGGGQRTAAVIHPSEEELRILLRGHVPLSPNP